MRSMVRLEACVYYTLDASVTAEQLPQALADEVGRGRCQAWHRGVRGCMLGCPVRRLRCTMAGRAGLMCAPAPALQVLLDLLGTLERLAAHCSAAAAKAQGQAQQETAPTPPAAPQAPRRSERLRVQARPPPQQPQPLQLRARRTEDSQPAARAAPLVLPAGAVGMGRCASDSSRPEALHSTANGGSSGGGGSIGPPLQRCQQQPSSITSGVTPPAAELLPLSGKLVSRLLQRAGKPHSPRQAGQENQL